MPIHGANYNCECRVHMCCNVSTLTTTSCPRRHSYHCSDQQSTISFAPLVLFIFFIQIFTTVRERCIYLLRMERSFTTLHIHTHTFVCVLCMRARAIEPEKYYGYFANNGMCCVHRSAVHGTI